MRQTLRRMLLPNLARNLFGRPLTDPAPLASPEVTAARISTWLQQSAPFHIDWSMYRKRLSQPAIRETMVKRSKARMRRR